MNKEWYEHGSIINKIVTELLFLVIATGWFTLLFKYLASAHPDWKDALTGGSLTGVFIYRR